jgi:hypothetical protein
MVIAEDVTTQPATSSVEIKSFLIAEVLLSHLEKSFGVVVSVFIIVGFNWF